MSETPERPRTALVLERWRKQTGLSKQRLADLADVSATYVRTIEAGRDTEGRTVVPSAAIMRKLARGLALSEPDQTQRLTLERQAYNDLMGAAGYLEVKAPRAPSPREAPALRSASLPEPSPSTAAARSTVTVALRDPRLWSHGQPILENWESLRPDDQALLLGILEFIHDRSGRGPAGQQGGS